MKGEKSKIIKLKQQQNRLKFWRDKGEWYIMGNAFLSTIPFAFATSINMGLGFSIFAFIYLISSIASICVHMLYGKEKMFNKIKNLDQDILELVKTDEQEFEILKEYDKIETLEREIKGKEREIEKQKRLIEKMIEKKNLDADKSCEKDEIKIKQYKKKISIVEEEIEQIKHEEDLFQQ